MGPTVIVLGGGMLGAATAFRLAQGGARVTLLDAGRLGGGASVVSFAWLNANNKPPFDYHLLNVSGMHEYHRLRQEFGATPWLHLTGNVEWDNSDGGPTRLREKVSRLRSWGYPAELLPMRDLPLLEPDLITPPEVEEFALYPGEGYVDPVQVVGVLAAGARAAGAEIRTQTAVEHLVMERDRVSGVETTGGDRLRADMVVSCVGRWSDELARLSGIDLPMAPTVGMVVITAPSAVQLRSVHHNEAMELRPDGGERVMMRHRDFDERVQPDDPVDPAICAELFDRVVRVLPGLAGTPIEAVRVATRPIPGDHYSVVGPAPGVDGLYLMLTHSAVTLGPLLGRLASYEILSGDLDARLDRFRPERLVEPALA